MYGLDQKKQTIGWITAAYDLEKDNSDAEREPREEH